MLYNPKMVRTKADIFTDLKREKRISTAEEVVALLRDMIQRGEISAGDRLPPERDLAKLLGISRPTLRAGIRSLTTVGILRSRQGSGTFVSSPGESSMAGTPLKTLSALYGYTSDEIFEARLVLEVNISGLAAEKATSEQIAFLAEEVKGLYAALDDPEQFVAHERRFNETIAAASKNRILTTLLNMVTAIADDAQSSKTKRFNDLENSAELQQNIYREINEHDPEAAQKAMHAYLLTTRADRPRKRKDGEDR